MPNAPAAVSDTRGEFEIADVPPGPYTLTASRAGYLTVQYGQRRPRELGRTIQVRAAETVDKIEIALPKGCVLAGTITDETGEPAPGVRVEALEYRFIRGHRILVPARQTSTNDIGEYRLSGLEPGSYRLRASSSDVWEGDDGKTTHVYGVTYFPGVTAANAPQTLNLQTGQEIGGLDFALMAGRSASVTGTVEDANGTPMPDQRVYLSDIARGVGGRLVSSGQGAPPTRTDDKGQFAFSKLPPGEYLAYAGNDQERTSITVVLGDGDARRITLRPHRSPEVIGSVTTDEGTPPPFVASRVRLMTIPTDPDRVLPRWGESGGVTVRADWTFRATDLDGPQLFRVTGLPDDWMLAAVRIGQRDITDTPFAVPDSGADIKGVEIVLSRKIALLNGEVGGQGSTAADATVIVFAEDSALWGPGSRFVRAVRPDDRGRFSIPALPPARYRVAAAEAVMDGQWEDPAFLQTLVRTSTAIELREGLVENIMLQTGGAR